jgi:hypothetical protein
MAVAMSGATAAPRSVRAAASRATPESAADGSGVIVGEHVYMVEDDGTRTVSS